MVAINSDPAVTEFLNRRMDAAATAAFLDRTEEHWAEHGFGHWAVEPTEGPLAGEMIGFVGVAYPTFLPELATRPELGWRLAAPPGAAATRPRPPSPPATTPSPASPSPS